MNIYDRDPTDEGIEKWNLLSTKLYFIALTASLAVFALFILLSTQAKTITVHNPTQSQFEHLKNLVVDSLQCPCSQIAIKYQNFIAFDPKYHQLCSSVFVSGLWHNNDFWLTSSDISQDFRAIIPYFVALLSQFCRTANEIIGNSSSQFLATTYITSQVIANDSFNHQVNSSIELFQKTTQESYKQTLNLVRSVIFVNQLISAKRSNVGFCTFNSSEQVEVHSCIRSYDNCSCGTDSACKKQLSFYPPNGTEDYLLGMYLGCYFADSLLSSTMECFFDQLCIDKIKSYMDPSYDLYDALQPLNTITEPSQYDSSTRIETLVNNLFIEAWNPSYSYEKYYGHCQPLYCSYTVEKKSDILFVITRLTGLYGGLSTILKYLIPCIVIFIARRVTRESSMADYFLVF